MRNKIIVKHREGNITTTVCDVIKNLPSDCENIIEFEKGTYFFQKEGSDTYPIFSSSGRLCDGRKGNVLFPIINQKNITIEGNGANFIFCDRFQPFMVQNSCNVIIKNIAVDYSFLRYAYAEVVSVSNEGIRLFIDEELIKYEVDNGNINFVCGKEKLSTKQHKISLKQMTPGKKGICFLYVGDTTCELNKAAKNVFADAERCEDGIFLKYRNGTEDVGFGVESGDRLCLAYDNDREYQMFWLDNSKNIEIQNVSVYRNGGMGIVADVCEDVLIDGVNFSIKPGRKEYYSSTADAIFMTNCSGNIIIRNSSIEDTYDDAINIHGFYTKVEEVLPDNRIKLKLIHPAHIGTVPVKSGDKILFNDPKSGNVLLSAEVKDVWNSKDRCDIFVTVDQAQGINGGMIAENITRMPKVLIENNRIYRCPHIRLSAPDMIIRNNDLNLNNADVYISDLWGYWSEYGSVENVIISGNKFGDSADLNIKIGSERPEGHNRKHKNIIIENNIFVKPRRNAISIISAENVLINNNEFGE